MGRQEVVALAVLLLLCLVMASDPNHSALAADFVAGVVEHVPSYNASLSPLQNMLLNVAIFEMRAKEASAAGVQLLVFPEFSLWASAGSASRTAILPWCEPIPDPAPNLIINPCTAPDREFAASPVLKRLSCIARNAKLYAAFNHFEIQPCQSGQQQSPDCPNDGHYLWNTMVVFDPNGNLIAKYHKTNPFWSEPFNKPNQTQVVTFNALGTTFGIFVCFDILHSEPAQSLLNLGVRHFVYSAAIPKWASSTLFSTWSKWHQSTLIASNLGDSPHFSGIFLSGQNTAIAVPDSKILIAKVPTARQP